MIVPLDGKSKSAHTFSATRGLSPVATLTSIPRAANCPKESRAAAFGSSANTRKPSSVSPDSSSAVMADRPGAGLLATATTRLPSANSASSVCLLPSGRSVQLASTCSGAPLTTSRRPAASSNSADVARRV